MPQTLLDITEDLRALDALLEEFGGDISEPAAEAAVSQWVAELEANLGRKAEGYAALISELDARVEFRRSEARRLAERAKVDERKADWLRHRLLDAMNRTGTPVIETERYRLSVARNGGKQPLDIHDVVPTDWCRVEVVQQPDKDRIREALEQGTHLPFANLMPRGERLVIR
jgi:hypothetical protein